MPTHAALWHNSETKESSAEQWPRERVHYLTLTTLRQTVPLFNEIGGDYLCQWTIPSLPSFKCGFIIRMAAVKAGWGFQARKAAEAAKAARYHHRFIK